MPIYQYKGLHFELPDGLTPDQARAKIDLHLTGAEFGQSQEEALNPETPTFASLFNPKTYKEREMATPETHSYSAGTGAPGVAVTKPRREALEEQQEVAIGGLAAATMPLSIGSGAAAMAAGAAGASFANPEEGVREGITRGLTEGAVAYGGGKLVEGGFRALAWYLSRGIEPPPGLLQELQGAADEGVGMGHEQTAIEAMGVGRPMMRRRYRDILLNMGRDPGELEGLSARQLKALVEGAEVPVGTGRPARGGARRSLIDMPEPGPVPEESPVDVDLFEEDLGIRGGVDAPQGPPVEQNPTIPGRARTGAPPRTVEGRPQTDRAWHPDLGVVRVELLAEGQALVIPERGRPRLVPQESLKWITDEAIEGVPARAAEPEIGRTEPPSEGDNVRARSDEPVVDREQEALEQLQGDADAGLLGQPKGAYRGAPVETPTEPRRVNAEIDSAQIEDFGDELTDTDLRQYGVDPEDLADDDAVKMRRDTFTMEEPTPEPPDALLPNRLEEFTDDELVDELSLTAETLDNLQNSPDVDPGWVQTLENRYKELSVEMQRRMDGPRPWSEQAQNLEGWPLLNRALSDNIDTMGRNELEQLIPQMKSLEHSSNIPSHLRAATLRRIDEMQKELSLRGAGLKPEPVRPTGTVPPGYNVGGPESGRPRPVGVQPPDATPDQLIGRRNLGPDTVKVDGNDYEVRSEGWDGQLQGHTQQIAKRVMASRAGQNYIKLVEGSAEGVRSFMGKVMGRLKGLSPHEALPVTTTPYRGVRYGAPGSTGLGQNMAHYVPSYIGNDGGFVTDPWLLATNIEEEYMASGMWQHHGVFKYLPEDLQVRANPYRQSGKPLPDKLRREVAASLFAHRTRYTAIHEPVHSVPDALHETNDIQRSQFPRESAVLPGHYVKNDPQRASRWDEIWEGVKKTPEAWESPHYRALMEPSNRKTLIEMYETFEGTRNGRLGHIPPDPPPPPGSPPLPPNPHAPGPGSPEAKLRKLFRAQKEAIRQGNIKTRQLHAKQARVMKYWQNQVDLGYITPAESNERILATMKDLKANFDRVETPDFTPEEFEALTREIHNAPWQTDRFETFRALNAFDAAQRGKKLQQNELDLLKKYFPREAVVADPHWTMRFLDELRRLPNSLRTVKTAYDISAPGRQGFLLSVAHPIKAGKAFKAQLKALRSPEYFAEIEREIFSRPMRELGDSAGLHLSKPGHGMSFADAFGMSPDVPGGGAEEVFGGRGNIAEKLPGVRASERAYITYLNKLRADIFDARASDLLRKGLTFESNPHEFTDLAKAINELSGRGAAEVGFFSAASPIGKAAGLADSIHLGKGYLEKAVPLAGSVAFSPRFVFSRFSVLRDLPMLYTNYSKPARQLLWRSVLGTIALGYSVLTLAELAGAEVEWDADSSDFAKIKLDKVRYDIWAGFQPWVRFVHQMKSGQRKPLYNFGKEPIDRLQSTYRFAEQKAAPATGIVIDALRGKDFKGDPLEVFADEFPYLGEYALDTMLPMVISDIREAYNAGELDQLPAVAAASAVGLGVQVHQDRKRGR